MSVDRTRKIVLAGRVFHFLVLSVMLTGRVAAENDDVTFAVRFVSDTVYEYESVIATCTVSNNGAAPFYHKPLLVGPGFLRVAARNLETSEPLQVCGHNVNWWPDKDITKHPAVLPGEVWEYSFDLLSVGACTSDAAVHLPSWPAGHYRFTFSWSYDPLTRGSTRIPPVLADSADVRILAPNKELADHRNAFFRATLAFRESGVQVSCDELWNVVLSNPASPYARQSLRLLEFHLRTGGYLPSGVSISDFMQKFISVAPNRPECQVLVKQLVAGDTGPRRADILDSILQAHPGTIAGRVAEKLLKEK